MTFRSAMTGPRADPVEGPQQPDCSHCRRRIELALSTQTGNSEQPKADVLLRPREPLVIERSVPPIFVDFEQRLVDALTQAAAIGDGNTVLLRREDWTNDP